jgi:ABC-type transport system substrate-binding protein
MLGYYPGNNNPHYNLRQAHAELARCPGRSALVNLKYLNFGPPAVNAYTLIASELRAIGMDIKLTALSEPEWFAVAGKPLSKTDTQLLDGTWTQDYPDPQDYLFYLLHSGSPDSRWLAGRDIRPAGR